jgi:hypothetical protein
VIRRQHDPELWVECFGERDSVDEPPLPVGAPHEAIRVSAEAVPDRAALEEVDAEEHAGDRGGLAVDLDDRLDHEVLVDLLGRMAVTAETAAKFLSALEAAADGQFEHSAFGPAVQECFQVPVVERVRVARHGALDRSLFFEQLDPPREFRYVVHRAPGFSSLRTVHANAGRRGSGGPTRLEVRRAVHHSRLFAVAGERPR